MDDNANVIETEIGRVWIARIKYVASEILLYEG